MKDKLIELVHQYNLLERTRKRDKVYKRFFLMSELHKYMNLTDTGKIFKMKHCSVLHGIRQHLIWMEVKDPEYLKAIDEIYQELYQIDVNDIADQNIHVKTLGIQGHLVDVSIKLISVDSRRFHRLNGIMTKEEFKKCCNLKK